MMRFEGNMTEQITVEKATIIEQLMNDAVAIITVLVVLSMAVMSIPVPEWLIAAFGLVLAFYFRK